MSAPRSTFSDSHRGHSTQPYSTLPLPYRELGRGGVQSQQNGPDELTKAASPDPAAGWSTSSLRSESLTNVPYLDPAVQMCTGYRNSRQGQVPSPPDLVWV